MYGQYVFLSRFYTLDRFPMNLSFTSEDLQTFRIFVFGAQKTQDCLKNVLHSELVAVSGSVHANGVISLYYFTNETVREADYHQMLDTPVRSEAQ